MRRRMLFPEVEEQNLLVVAGIREERARNREVLVAVLDFAFKGERFDSRRRARGEADKLHRRACEKPVEGAVVVWVRLPG